MPDFNPEPWLPKEVGLASTTLDYDFGKEGEVSKADSTAKNAMSSDNLSNQSCNLTSATGDTAPLKSQFDQYGLLAESNANDPPQNCGISGSAPGQEDLQEDTGSNGHPEVYSFDHTRPATYPKPNAFEPLVSDQVFYQSDNTNGVEENHHSNQRGTKRKCECAEGLYVSRNGLSESNSHANTLSTQDTGEDPHSRDLLDKSSPPMRFQDRPLKLQEIIYKCMFPAGRAAFIDFVLSPNCLKPHERLTGLPITMAICKASRKFTKEHYTIVKRHGEGIRGVNTKSFCFNPEVDTLCISYNFREPWQRSSSDMYDYWYDKVDRKLKKKGALKDVGLQGVKFLDVRDVVTGYPVDTSDISWFLPRLYKNSFLSRFENLERLVFTSALKNEPEIYEDEPGGVFLNSLEECEIFWEELAEYLEKQKDSYKGKLVAKERVIVREYEAPQDRRALEGLEMMNLLF
ncbi:hypothetical protein BcDW1_9893 [Botrytis cinerea BcDW1]|uniref:Uncharacterized protein n=1 Tax=Botryotinia fuckeliana (strain BcDW1) TaxID=1290391 RepID=M7TK23_BOTF1|nr:hypothetical protein BcDW1_9893 [Botrytis cinerea BcDW1]